MAVVALLDANVLHPMPLCDTLLRLAESGLFYPRWSNEILDELVRSLDRRWPAARRAHMRRRRRMETAFEEAVVDPLPYLAQVPPDVDPKDRHVAAAALSAGAEVIVTQNVRHFGREVLGSIDLSVQHPDEFLLELWRQDRDTVLQVLREQAAALRSPRLGVHDILDLLAPGAPRFAQAVLPQVADEAS